MHNRPIKVLLIDENTDYQQTIERWLQESHTFHYVLSYLPNYQLALSEILSEIYDICLINYEIANKQGLLLLCEANSHQCNTPLILLTDHDDTEIDLLAMVSGATDYLVKSTLNAQLLERSIRYGIERKQTEKKLLLANEQNRRLAEYDTLTGLANRNLFNKTLTEILARAKRSNLVVAVLFLDLDNFKAINDSLGHDIGDLLLQDIATRLRQSLRKTDPIFRLGGDEFTIIIEGDYDMNKIATVAEKIIHLIRQVFVLRGNQVFITASVGIATSLHLNLDAETLLKSADTAMYSEKQKGGNNHQFFTAKLNQQVLRRIAVEKNLRHAMEKKEFFLHYQPRVDLRTGLIVGVEALARWHNSELHTVPPLDFIPVAEDTGMICMLGEWVIQTACEQLQAWRAQGITQLPRMSVNLSIRQLNQENLVEVIQHILAVTQIAPAQLELEITESTIMNQPEANIAILDQLHALGITIAVDDFGTGYSSLAYLKLLPLDALKIDRMFVQDILLDNNAVLVKAIITLGKSLGLLVVAEGVETKQQLDFLREHQCDEMQGYYFSQPVSADALTDMLTGPKNLPH